MSLTTKSLGGVLSSVAVKPPPEVGGFTATEDKKPNKE